MKLDTSPLTSPSLPARPRGLDRVAAMLRPGKVYRREDFAQVSNSVDRHLRELVACGALKRPARGLYYAPKKSVYGTLPPDDEELIAAFLRDKEFLVFSPSIYNGLGLGTTQLYHHTIVYNHKRHGIIYFGKRQFDFRIKRYIPKELTREFLLVDAINNLDELDEDRRRVLQAAEQTLSTYDQATLKHAVSKYASVATKKLFMRWFNA